MELIFLAATTELPKLVTTSAAVVSGNAAIALTHIFGGITMQATTLTVTAAAAHRFAGSKR
jgi:Ca2+/Na+ antiporter